MSMARTQIQLPLADYKRLRKKAHREKVSLSELVRRGVNWVLADEVRDRAEAKRRLLEAATLFQSGDTRGASDHDLILADVYSK